jgi:hypothetical protein
MTPVVMPWTSSKKSISIHDLRVGSVVKVRPNFGMSHPVQGTVVSFGTNGNRDVIDYRTASSTTTSWAYMHQIDEVVEF